MDAAELAVVVPAYNEAECIASVVERWAEELDRLGVDYALHLYDDGSADDTPKILDALAREHPRLVVHRRENAGHGPTVLRGYRECAASPWILQVDSDDEMPPEAFEALWSRREEHDLLVGERVHREMPPARRLVTAVARLAVRSLFGGRVSDVNAPYRLMRSDAFAPLYRALPEDTFAPNVILTGLAAMKGLRVGTVPVPHRPRETGESSIQRLKLLKGAGRALRQTLRVRLRGLP